MVLTQLGNPILRARTQKVFVSDVASDSVKQVITQMKTLLATKDFGVGLAAPQIGTSISIAVIDIKPTKHRPNVQPYASIIINPTYEGIGKRSSMWEGCLSSGTGDNTLYAKALRYKTIQATWLDENTIEHAETLEGLPAQVFQHETDHLHGILFVDRVRSSKTYTMASEYRSRISDGTINV